MGTAQAAEAPAWWLSFSLTGNTMSSEDATQHDERVVRTGYGRPVLSVTWD
jgi:hypothetical protein